MRISTTHIAKICYWLQLHRIAYFLNRNRKRTITFHNVLDDDIFVSNVANGVSSSFSGFKKIIDEVSRYYTFSLDFDDPKTVTITFDDGYSNQAEVAGRYLMSRKIPAYLFVAGQLIKKPNYTELPSLTIDKLLHWISYVPAGEYIIDFINERIQLNITNENRNQIWSKTIWPLFIRDSKCKGNALFTAVDKAYPFSLILEVLSEKYKSQRLDGVSISQLETLKENGWQIGWHTLSHFPVAKLLQTDKYAELTPDSICNSHVFSFPYGGIDDIDEESIAILKQEGYNAAVSNINSGHSKYGNWYRSRMMLPSNKYLLHFELSGLKYFIKHKKLLPTI